MADTVWAAWGFSSTGTLPYLSTRARSLASLFWKPLPPPETWTLVSEKNGVWGTGAAITVPSSTMAMPPVGQSASWL